MKMTITRSQPTTSTVELAEKTRHVIDGKGRVFQVVGFEKPASYQYYLSKPEGKVCFGGNVLPPGRRFILEPLTN